MDSQIVSLGVLFRHSFFLSVELPILIILMLCEGSIFFGSHSKKYVAFNGIKPAGKLLKICLKLEELISCRNEMTGTFPLKATYFLKWLPKK